MLVVRGPHPRPSDLDTATAERDLARLIARGGPPPALRRTRDRVFGEPRATRSVRFNGRLIPNSDAHFDRAAIRPDPGNLEGFS
jgi:hypothetical protein